MAGSPMPARAARSTGYWRAARRSPSFVIGATITADVDGGAVAGAPAKALSAAAQEGAGKAPLAVASIGLKKQVYDMAEIRQGRSDDWRWTGAPR